MRPHSSSRAHAVERDRRRAAIAAAEIRADLDDWYAVDGIRRAGITYRDPSPVFSTFRPGRIR